VIAVDSTVLADWLFNEEALREGALRLQAMDSDWVCLALARYELGNVGWKLVRAGKITMVDLQLGWKALEVSGIRFLHEIEWAGVSVLAAERAITFYDAAHVWMAASNGLALFSRDGRLRARCPEVVCAMP
jgi:predicted nucleic acid-binding protein